MTTATSQGIRRPTPPAFRFVWIPSRKVEYAYYFVMAYSLSAAYLGIEVPLVAAATIVALACFCYMRMRPRRRDLYGPIALLVACQISFILVQVVVHDLPVMADHVRLFILWICGMVIVRSLSLRPGFLPRCTIVIFALGMIAVPHLGSMTDIVDRARADIAIGGGLQNPNGLGAWFGFCVVSFAIMGLETTRGIVVRALYCAAAVGSLLIVALTVSRGALLGCAIALAVGFRHILKRGFVPVLLLLIFVGIVLESGWYDRIVAGYTARATEETGRFLIWPYVVDRILAEPLVGVGVSKIATYSPEIGGSISTPHNSFLFFGLSSGIIPLALYIAFWIVAGWRSFTNVRQSEYSAFKAPFFVYAFVAFILADISTEPWVLVTLAVAAGSRSSYLRERLLVTYRSRNRILASSLHVPSRPETIRQ